MLFYALVNKGHLLKTFNILPKKLSNNRLPTGIKGYLSEKK